MDDILYGLTPRKFIIILYCLDGSGGEVFFLPSASFTRINQRLTYTSFQPKKGHCKHEKSQPKIRKI